MKSNVLYFFLFFSCLWIHPLFPQNQNSSHTHSCQGTLPPSQQLSEDFIYLHYYHIPNINGESWSLKWEKRGYSNSADPWKEKRKQNNKEGN